MSSPVTEFAVRPARLPGVRVPVLCGRAALTVILVLLAGCKTTSVPVDPEPRIVAVPPERVPAGEPVVEVPVEPRAGDADAIPHNIILFVADGCGPASFTMARQFLQERRQVGGLALDSILVGQVATRAANALITDSASSATAYACGIKTNNGMIGMGPDGSSPESVVEAAESAGMATGLVVTTRITHATPAAFSAHVPERGMESEIASQQIASNIDLLVGGGRQFFLPGSAGGSREDGRDLLAEAAAAGYVVLDAYADLDTLSSLPVLALLSLDHMPYEVDRPDDFPSLSVMTERAIELLSDDQDGFFLMVEGSRIDHAGHANDISGHLHDILAYDAAVSTALRFARNDGQTLVVSVSDHETGGLTIGRSVGTSSAYEWQPEVADHITASHHVILEAVRNDGRPTREILEAYTGITDFTDEEIAGVMTEGWGANSALAEMISRRILIGWTTTGHTAVDVGLFAFGPGSDRLKGHVENSRLGLTLLDLVKSRNMGR